MSNSAYHEYVKELEFIANEYIQDQTGLVLPKSVNEHYAEWEEMAMDPTWQTDPSSSPPSFRDWLMDCAEWPKDWKKEHDK